jgi:alpha-tubulin suppressor-like RCC1 family protein
MRNSPFSFAFLSALGLVACAEAPRDVALDTGDAALSVARTQPTLATGRDHACALRSDGALLCWGANDFGQLGNANLTDQPSATAVSGVSRAIAVAAGHHFTCVLDAQGTVKCFGLNSSGQLGRGSLGLGLPEPAAVSGISNAIAITAGSAHACALLADGTASCWGAGDNGRLGYGSLASSSVPRQVLGLTKLADIDAGNDHTCAVDTAGTTTCWGAHQGGTQVNGGDRLLPGVVAFEPARSVEAGLFQTCALGRGGQPWCWSTQDAPLELGDQTATDLDAYGHSCLVRADGSVACEGDNTAGEVGNGTQLPQESFAAVLGLDGATKVATGERFTCAQLALGGVRCWGDNTRGQLGDGSTASRAVALPVSGLGGSFDVSLGVGSGHACAVSAVKARCWGGGDSGQLGDGRGTSSLYALNVATDEPLRQLISVGSSTLALTARGTLLATGRESSESFADGPNRTSSQPPMSSTSLVPIASSLSGITRLASAGWYTCALIQNGDVKCWGYNGTERRSGVNHEGIFAYAGFNDAVWEVTASTPTAVNDLGSDATVDLVAGSYHLCALRDDGTVRCRGRNDSGQLGRGTTITNASTPPYAAGARVTNLDDAIDVAAGSAHSCAVRANGRVVCFGDNEFGQLGDGTRSDRNLPSAVGALAPRAVSVVAGNRHSCALTSDGSVYCWGLNDVGQLGDGSTTHRSTPVRAGTLDDVVLLEAGGNTTCATRSTGAVYCWGENSLGQVGDASGVDRSTPSAVSNGIFRFPGRTGTFERAAL